MTPDFTEQCCQPEDKENRLSGAVIEDPTYIPKHDKIPNSTGDKGLHTGGPRVQETFGSNFRETNIAQSMPEANSNDTKIEEIENNTEEMTQTSARGVLPVYPQPLKAHHTLSAEPSKGPPTPSQLQD